MIDLCISAFFALAAVASIASLVDSWIKFAHASDPANRSKRR